MASGPITSWQIDGETMKTVTDFIFLGSKITADGDCSHKTKRCLLLGIKTLTNIVYDKAETLISNKVPFGQSCGEGNGNPLQCSCLENPMDGGAQWAIQFMGSQRVGHN